MDVLYPHCAGLDIHKKVVVACRLVPGGGRAPVDRMVRSFGTTTGAIEQLGDWLAEAGVTHVAMEATGVYWQPLYNLLEDRFTLVLANAQHIQQVPGRKTDVKDAEWIADLLRHGLIRGSFVPDRAQRELRELTRYRVTLVRERAAVVNRLQKTLEGANIKLGDVASDVLGVSGRAMLERLIAGETDPVVLAGEARQQLRAKRPALEAALRGSVGPHQRFLLRQQLTHIDQLDAQIATVSTEIERRLQADPAAERPVPPSPPPSPTEPPPPRAEPLIPNRLSGAAAVAHLDTIPGVGRRVAEIVVAEIGTDMRRFPSAAHLASWAGLCPGHHESAGRQFSGRTRKGNPTLRSTLIEAARAAAHTQTALAERYRRVAARRGGRRAAIAVAHAILVIAYDLLRDGTEYVDERVGPNAEQMRERTTRRLLQRLHGLGLNVQVTPSPA